MPSAPLNYVAPTDFAKSTTGEIAGGETGDQPLVFEARTSVGGIATNAVPTPALLQRPELPHHIAMQIAAAAQRGETNRPIDLILSPAELGPVRLSMSSLDGVMSVTVSAERPETLDLMRRHIETLAQEFLNIGYGKAQFSFAGGHSDQPAQNHADHSVTHTVGAEPQVNASHTTGLQNASILISDRLDIRL
ncbi:MAG: flagellar hook-length control protein FliK [Roseovarius sp.]|nr:flagellar hook-length control protein FliK [Roseovarius sp.]